MPRRLLAVDVQRFEFRADDEDERQRLDVVVARHTGLPRAQARAAVDDGRVTLRGQPAKRASSKVASGDDVIVLVPPPAPLDVVPQDIPLDIVHEDDDVVVVNKAAGMVVHPAAGHPDGTLVNALLHHCKGRLSGIGGVERPGIVHRIDRDTSGLLVITKNDAVHQALQVQFAAHTIGREYVALCARTSGPGLEERGTFATRHGRHPTDRKRFTGTSGPRHAVTHYEVRERFTDGAAMVTCTLETGRTHQIRVHLAEAGAPILGDPLYGGRAVAATPLIGRLALHARSLGFTLPDGRDLYFEVPPPEDLEQALARLRRGASWRK